MRRKYKLDEQIIENNIYIETLFEYRKGRGIIDVTVSMKLNCIRRKKCIQ